MAEECGNIDLNRWLKKKIQHHRNTRETEKICWGPSHNLSTWHFSQ